MGRDMKVTDFAVQFSRENILHLIDCYEDSPIYEEVLEEYERMTQEAYERMEPAAVLEFGKYRRKRQALRHRKVPGRFF